jgi:hypothetical protein
MKCLFKEWERSPQVVMRKSFGLWNESRKSEKMSPVSPGAHHCSFAALLFSTPLLRRSNELTKRLVLMAPLLPNGPLPTTHYIVTCHFVLCFAITSFHRHRYVVERPCEIHNADTAQTLLVLSLIALPRLH